MVRGTFATGQTALDFGITDLMVTTAADGSRVLYSTSGPTGGLSAFDVAGAAAPDLMDFTLYDGAWADGALHELTLFATETGAELFVAGNGEDQLTALTLSDSGTFDQLTQYQGLDATTARILDLDQLDTETLILSDAGTNTIQVYAISPQGTLARIGTVADTETTYAANVVSLDTLAKDDATYLISACQAEHGVTAYRIAEEGLVATGSIGMAEGLGIMVPTGVQVATIEGRSFVVVASAPGDGQGQSGAISILELGADGSLTPTDHVIDTTHTRFGMVNSLEVIDVDGRIYVLAGGGDDGLTLFTLLPNGRLQMLDVLADDFRTGLSNVTAMATHVEGNALEIFVASQAEGGITQLAIDLSRQGAQLVAERGGGALTGTEADDILLGGAGADLLQGGAGRDLIEDGAGADTLRGGAGADTFIFRADGELDIIADFEPGIDRIDLSGWSMLYDPAQLTITSTLTGALIEWRGETLEILTTTGQSLTSGDIFDAFLFAPNRIPTVNLPLESAGETIFGTSGDDRLDGSEYGDTLRGEAGDDYLFGDRGDDHLEGGNGTDTLLGGSGSDTLEATGGNGNLLRGGAGDDVLIGGWGSDILQGNDGADSFSGGTGADDLYIDGQDTFFDGGGGYDRLIAVDPGGVNVALSGTNIERVIGGTGDDVFDGTGVALGLVISGEGGNDTLTGGSATDQVSGGAGDDVLIGGGGDDFLFGDGGSDSFEGGAGDDRFFAESIDQSFDGGAGYDRLFLLDNGDFTFALAGTGIERVNSGDGNDVLDATGVTDAVVLSGAGGNDALTGGSNNDVLAGGDGQDTLEGGSGFDSFFGGAGADSFVFEDGSGVDFLVGWEDGLDLLDFSGHAQVNGLSDLTITDNGVNSRIEFADGDALIVIGYTGGFDASDFMFS
ncbi:calcium-binding protein [Roseicyclus elongatus]|nr:calcium-binding protein [Roseibacterium elongatum]